MDSALIRAISKRFPVPPGNAVCVHLKLPVTSSPSPCNENTTETSVLVIVISARKT